MGLRELTGINHLCCGYEARPYAGHTSAEQCVLSHRLKTRHQNPPLPAQEIYKRITKRKIRVDDLDKNPITGEGVVQVPVTPGSRRGSAIQTSTTSVPDIGKDEDNMGRPHGLRHFLDNFVNIETSQNSDPNDGNRKRKSMNKNYQSKRDAPKNIHRAPPPGSLHPNLVPLECPTAKVARRVPVSLLDSTLVPVVDMPRRPHKGSQYMKNDSSWIVY